MMEHIMRLSSASDHGSHNPILPFPFFVVSRSLPLGSTATCAALPAMSLTPVAPFLILTSYFFLSPLHQSHRGKCRLIDCRCDCQPVVSLVGCDGFPGHRSKDPIDRSIVVTGRRQLSLDIHGHLVRRQ